MSALSDFAEAHVLNYLLTNTAGLTRPTAWFVALHTSATPGDNGATGELATTSGYARQTATFAVSVSGTGTTDNSNAITFGPATTSNWGTVTAVSIWDNSTAGNCLFVGTMATGRVINTGDSLQFAVGALDVTLA